MDRGLPLDDEALFGGFESARLPAAAFGHAEHVRAAWSYINHADNAAKYTKDEAKTIKGRIKRAAKTHGVEISGD